MTSNLKAMAFNLLLVLVSQAFLKPGRRVANRIHISTHFYKCVSPSESPGCPRRVAPVDPLNGVFVIVPPAGERGCPKRTK